MHTILLYCLSMCCCTSFAATFLFEDFSETYSGEVTVTDTTISQGPGTISIREKKSGTVIIRVASNRIQADFTGAQLKANILELPYGDQSLIIYKDVNFDGIPDFAIQDGDHSCYAAPSYQIYLAEHDTFALNPEFTELGQSYCGMFMTDTINKRLYTMRKAGCCWHEYSTFVVKNNKPFPLLVAEVEDEYVKESSWNGNHMVVRHYKKIDMDSIEPVFSFTCVPSKKKAMFYHYRHRSNITDSPEVRDSWLWFGLLAERGKIEAGFPDRNSLKGGEYPFFTCNIATRSICFTSDNTDYRIYPEGKGFVFSAATASGTVHEHSYDASIRGNFDSILNYTTHANVQFDAESEKYRVTGDINMHEFLSFTLAESGQRVVLFTAKPFPAENDTLSFARFYTGNVAQIVTPRHGFVYDTLRHELAFYVDDRDIGDCLYRISCTALSAGLSIEECEKPDILPAQYHTVKGSLEQLLQTDEKGTFLIRNISRGGDD